MLRVTGKGATALFENEPGGHRWQRVPPTERNGRRQSSTVTVAILSERKQSAHFDESQIDFQTCCSGGPGGQNVNKVETKVQATYRPTGDTVSVCTERSQLQNRIQAVAMLRSRVLNRIKQARKAADDASRREQVGSGERSDKVRTVQVHNGVVTDHRTGKKKSLSCYLKGDIRF